MTSVAQDVINGARSSLAFKAPVRVASTANLTLSGEQTIDGVAVVAGDRVLVKNQTSGVNNGIYIADTSAWERAPDCDGTRDLVTGTLVYSVGGSTTVGFWIVSTTGTITVGTTSIAFSAASTVLLTVNAYWQTVLGLSTASAAFGAIAAEAIAYTGDISPTTLSANTDNWAPTGFSTASTIRMAATAAWNLTGIAAGADGRVIMLHNISAFSVTLKDDATSTAANRFQLNGDYTLGADSSVCLQYDATSLRWRLFGQQGAAAITTSVSFNRLLNNAGLAVTMSGNAVTIALKGADGTDPSASNIVTGGFRNATVATGQVAQRQVTAALSTVISSGSTGGTVSAQASRIWVALIDVSGTVELAWFQSVLGTTIAPIDDGGVISTTAEGGAGAADSAQTWYSTTARASVPFLILGYFDSTQTTAGTWAAAVTSIVINPSFRPGHLMQIQRNQTGAAATGSTTVPEDDTIPQITEGDQYMTQAITPKSACNLLRISILASITSTGAQGVRVISSLFQDATANALATSATCSGGSGIPNYVPLSHSFVANTAVATTLKFRSGTHSATTVTFNGGAGARQYGGVLASQMNIEEIAA